MKFYALISKAESKALLDRSRKLSAVLPHAVHDPNTWELQTCPLTPATARQVTIEMDIDDSLILPGDEFIICDSSGRNFRLTQETVDQAANRILEERELLAVATEALDMPMFPSETLVRDAIARCPVSQRGKYFGLWLMKAFERRRA